MDKVDRLGETQQEILKCCGECTDKLCCIYEKLVECYGKVRADTFVCVMLNENYGAGQREE